MTEQEVVTAIRTAVECAPSLRQLAETWGVSASYLSDCCNGRRAPGPSILKHLGITRRVVVTYEPDPAAKDWPRAEYTTTGSIHAIDRRRPSPSHRGAAG